MYAAASGNSELGIPKSVGEEFVGKDAGPFLSGLRTFLRGLMQWVAEEENEGEHQGDNADAAVPEKPKLPGGANDKAFDAMAFDKSVRSKDVDGRLHVETSNISKAAVNPYPGKDISNWEELRLDPDKIYMLLRHPDELAKPKTVDSFNNLQILSEHVPVSADALDSHHPELTIGSTGTDAKWDPPYLKNSLVFWAGPAIEAIEKGLQKELSCSYRYRAEMTPGTYEGHHYDGIMRDIEGNHVALVTKGRAGPDVAIGDSAEGLPAATDGDLKEDDMPKFSPAMLAGIKTKLTGVKLKSGRTLAQDANIDEIMPLIETIMSGGEETGADNGGVLEPNSAMTMGTMDEETTAQIRRDCRAADARRRLGRDETDEEKEKREAEDKAADEAECADDKAKDEKDEEDDDKAKDKKAKDKKAEDAMPRNLVTRQAMDSAVGAAVAAALAQAARTQSEIREAERLVRPYVGELAIAHDSADAVLRTTLTALGVNVEGVHPSAYRTILSYQPKPGAAQPREQQRAVAMDAASAASYAERFPGADKIRVI